MFHLKAKLRNSGLIALAAAVLMGGSAARAQTYLYSVDCNDNANNNAANTYSGAAVLGNAGDVWNGLAAATTPFTLQGTTANAPTITFTNLSLLSTYSDAGGTTSNPLLLMQDYFNVASFNTGTVTLSGLNPGANFTLVLYGAGNAAGQGSSFTLTGATGGNSASTLITAATDRNIANGLGDAYNTYTGIIGTSGSLTVSVTSNFSSDTQQYGVLNGLQLQETVPEPSTWASVVFLLGAGGLLLRRQRRACGV